jgi:serine/threonine protein kinase
MPDPAGGPSAGSAPEEILALTSDLMERVRRGERVSLSEYTARFPDLASRISEVLPVLKLLEELQRVEAAAPQRGTPGEAGDPSPGRSGRLGEYRILREIGRGGMGVVYEAEQESLGRRVALKVLPFHSLMDPRRLERFRQEARAAAKLEHPNIVPIHGYGEDGGVHYYAMQFVAGAPLDGIVPAVRALRGKPPLARGPSLEKPSSPLTSTLALKLLESGFPAAAAASAAPGETAGAAEAPPAAQLVAGRAGRVGSALDLYWRSVARVGVQVADGLGYAHGRGVLHRDIKPANILLDDSGRAWIADFGLAKAEGGAEVTAAGEMVGTPQYMAPERWSGRCDERSDVYGLGLTLYELAALDFAFHAEDRSLLLREILESGARPLSEVEPAVPRDLERIIAKAVAIEPSARYPSAASLSGDLLRFLGGTPVAAEALPAPAVRRGRGPAIPGRRGRRRRLLRVSAAVLEAAAIAAIALLLALGLVPRGTPGGGPLGDSAPGDSAPGGHDGVLARIEAGESPTALVVEDLDGDGRLDVAAANYDSGDVTLARNAGGFVFGAPASVLVGRSLYALRAGDLDGDLDLDLVASDVKGGAIALLRNGGGGAFEPAGVLEGGSTPGGMIVADLDLDGALDLAWAQVKAKKVSWRWSAGSPGSLSFAAGGDLEVGGEPYALAAGDWNQDGRMDLAAAGGGGDVWVLLQREGRVFSEEAKLAAGASPNDLVAVDLDRDGALDLVTANRGVPKEENAGAVSILRSLGGGAFEAPRTVAPGLRAFAVRAADLNADGRQDLVIAEDFFHRVSILWREDGGLDFAPPVSIRASKAPHGLEAADLDGDGTLELVVADFGARSVSVLRLPPPPPP